MGPPLMKAEQNRAIRVEDLTELVVGRSRFRQPNSVWYHAKLRATSATPMMVHVRLIEASCGAARLEPASMTLYTRLAPMAL